MVKPYNKQLNADITQLKILHAKKDKTEFNKMKSEIMKRHSISKATVYREMQKDVPGSYDRKRSERPVTAKEIQMVRELLEKQCKLKDIITVMERKTGMPYSWDRIDRIRGLVESEKLKVEGEKQENPEIKSETLSASGRTGAPSARGQNDNESGFGDNLREFIDELMDADKLAGGSCITVHINGVPYTLSRRAVKDITLIITNYAEADEDDLSELNRRRLMHVVTDKIRMLPLGSFITVKEVKELCDMNTLLTQQDKASKPMTIRDIVMAGNRE